MQKKLRLDLNELTVESFRVLPVNALAGRGTVEGRATGFRGSACTDCGECGGYDPDTGGETDTGTGTDTGGGTVPAPTTMYYNTCGGACPVETLMDYNTCGAQFSCQPYGWCGD